MYCSNCGSEIKKKLNYCNKCGARVSRDEMESIVASILEKPSKSPFQSISTAIAFIGLGGMLAIVIFALKLLDKGVDIGAIAIIIAMFLATILAIIFLLLRQLPQSQPTLKENFSETYQAPQGLNPANTAQLEEPREPVMSVTDQTTRTLDETKIKV
ncbi:MAG: zinc ribbon domain-containing protein [Pyrinomonadaceae bacterium]